MDIAASTNRKGLFNFDASDFVARGLADAFSFLPWDSTSSDSPDRPCFIGELMGAGFMSILLGGIGALIAGEQSVLQVALQALGAGGGAYAMAGPIGCPLSGPFAQTGAPKPPPSKVGRRHFALRLVGASVAGLLAWFAFPKGLDFAFFASSMLVSAGSASASFLSNPLEAYAGPIADSHDEDCQDTFPSVSDPVVMSTSRRYPSSQEP
mmetsp:Transcript_62921/g.99902  ORF Transcript_62921/g.99902 Transcript_62921/m.99902 type:complete len:209 (+) Transcript_62921:60-686(+)